MPPVKDFMTLAYVYVSADLARLGLAQVSRREWAVLFS
jgi:hypothetical protein